MSSDGRETVDYRTSINSLYMLFCTSLLPLVVIGIAFFYSGLTQRRSAMTMFAIPLLITPMIILDWYIWGYSLCYAATSNGFIGSLKYAVLRQIKGTMKQEFTNRRGNVLVINHFLFNMFFKIICAALTFPGCIAERGRILPMLLFLFIWSVIIYNPVTYWFWSDNGWLLKMDVLDFAGGNCVHIVSGFTALAYSYILGIRNPKILYNYRNANTGHVMIGTFLVLCGWCGFVAGCDFKFSYNSIFIVFSTILAASTSAIVWTAIDYLIGGKKFSMISFSSGCLTGLVVFTPGGGYISSDDEFWKPIVFGVIGAIASNFATRLKYYFGIDDALDIFAIHGVAGIVGSLLTGIFANKLYNSKGGWVVGHWKQFGYQLLGIVVTSAYVFILTCFFLYIIDFIPGCHLRIDKNFNRREREKRKARRASEVVETQQEKVSDSSVDDEAMDPYEQMELLGSDHYEFNNEYMMDHIEFIKVLSPEDYDESILKEEVMLSPIENHSGNSFQIHHDNNLTKRD
ncbi:uncharacterized protein KGF55_001638 [Candida pseudojiufengensis]|uniref:uncharacterized protein n=1 Tax=Candida pseudojiufengensis TaxID=497109 RepID=UPI002224CE15|nr:uncharacterized protein KGF55_001638 [Candida pseudojiufengensis]KAI5964569.1 hypothetical protein KGF55_001638 [Candida pseudojiufengensis]